MLIGEISFHSRLPVLSINTNVYVDGIFDMLHIGHLRHFERAAQLGTRLFVGVVNDEDATPYKRKPIMTHAERCELVATSKWVFQVIPNAPCVPGGLDEKFIRA
jgi:cytidyltransferase-like protein